MTGAPPALADSKGQPLRLGRELARGGEGAIFDLSDHPQLVAKLYHAPPERTKADKLTAMVAGGSERLRKIAAWPIDTVHDRAGGGVRGFVMRRVVQKDIHVLYGPKTRLRAYPDATYRFLVHVAANLARAFAVVHDHGHVIGDVNQGGVCVALDGTVTLVDCDSFQIRSAPQVFACDVGLPIYQPPEHQGVRSFHGLARRANHDNFGLAVLIFQTLFLARHPFAGAFQGDGDMPIERAIGDYRFAYARDAARRDMKQPPGSLGLGAVPTAVAELFERAFLEGGALGIRPSALEWMTALDGFGTELRDCTYNASHAYVRTLTRCPLCELEGKVGVVLFLPPRPPIATSPSSSPIDIEALWRELMPIVEPPRAPPPRVHWVLPLGVVVGLLLIGVSWPAACGVIAAAAMLALLLGKRRERALQASGLPELAERATALHRALTSYPLRERERLNQLARNRRERQLHTFLDKFEVKDSRLKGFGPGLYAALVSHGIETADDLIAERLHGIAGFGAKRIAALLGWRRALEARFQFDPSDATEASEQARVRYELQLECTRELAEFRQLADQLKALG